MHVGEELGAHADLCDEGWQWRNNGVIIPITQGGPGGACIPVFIPLSRLWVEFAREMHAAGTPMHVSGVGDYSVGGFFGGIKKAARKYGKKARRAARKAKRRATKLAKQQIRLVTLGQQKRLMQLARSKALRRGMAIAAIAVPVAAPALLGASAALEAANRAYDAYKTGRTTAEAIRRGIRRPGDVQRMLNARNAQTAVQHAAKLARSGDPQARQFVSALGRRRNRAIAAAKQRRRNLSHAARYLRA